MGSEKISYEDLRRDRDRFVAFAFSVADAFVELDGENFICYAAGALNSLAGYDGIDLIGRNFHDLLAPADRPLLKTAHETALSQGRCGPFRIHIRRHDGGEIALEARCTNLLVHGGGLFIALNQEGGPRVEAPTAREKSAIRKRTFEANQVIFDQNELADRAYILRSGSVDIRIGTRGSNPNTLTTIKVGDVFGELALLEKRSHSAAAIATEKSETLEVPRAEFMERLNASDLVMKTVVGHLVRRLRETTTDYEDLRNARWED
ncbi:MAG: cyclic nucleotide-binding domain-containing protein [Rhodospirillaceae bacterium]|jgi:PAS domain S-box-containing protein|nr:cyclic nucleotide-binding domain-containing protein [Rhodospirillaceae bacterium]MBT4486180.1 cyclic nucleotide-binding domain-containing protein [Rhodospirillaceae bacterium]MBT5898868.1 cyclic nucleotide-binding domain-containing protein [Rhodospirillaceae bacterium]MBT6428493.1 cyclic nucleotide-binding domain-containing protein [Rhodospirillaceae bacterium]MBT7759442.1 cyclic nucleotide-binding domain-containing protein [Rhodospirillaceae bacterium]